jgi:hypothetical protein
LIRPGQHSRGGIRGLVVCLLALAVGAGSLVRPVKAQSAAINEVRAAFLVNFAKFVEWPPDAFLSDTSPFVIGVLGDDTIAYFLRREINRSKPINGHELTVRIMKPDGPIRSCHVLYVGDLDAKLTDRILETLKNSPVFTVSAMDRFAIAGGVAQLIFENDQMRFAINLPAAHRARLLLSSKLMTLAKSPTQP